MTSNYAVMAVTLIIWVGLFVYLLRLDRKVKRLEEKK
jgi:CcmD family protein